MFNLKFRSLLSASVLILGGILAADAQIAPGSRLTVNIPNSFIVNNKSFAAGEYTISREPGTVGTPFLTLHGDGDTIVFYTTPIESANFARNTELIFDNVDGKYFLSKIWVKGDKMGSEIIKSKSEREMIAREKTNKTVTVDTGL